jgi:hypothetical protein
LGQARGEEWEQGYVDNVKWTEKDLLGPNRILSSFPFLFYFSFLISNPNHTKFKLYISIYAQAKLQHGMQV